MRPLYPRVGYIDREKFLGVALLEWLKSILKLNLSKKPFKNLMTGRVGFDMCGGAQLLFAPPSRYALRRTISSGEAGMNETLRGILVGSDY